MNWTLQLKPLNEMPFSQITFLANQNDLQLRQRLQVSCNKGQAKNERRCVDVMSNERYCKNYIMSGVGAHYVLTTSWKNNPGHGVLKQFHTFSTNNFVQSLPNFEAGEATWNTQ